MLVSTGFSVCGFGVSLRRCADAKTMIVYAGEMVAMNSIGSRVIGTIAACVGWFVFIVLYLAFFAGGFDFWQKLAVFAASGAIVVGIIAILWIRWVLK